ncbi:MAG: site-2 protease family protein [Candidatus Thermoplasmatota archaeon]|nr:site-2 protease family protein [Candidatus Thermoplasmatota archaeon]
MVQSAPPDASKEIEFVKGLVARHFPVYDVRISYDVVQFFCKIDESILEVEFETLREEMAPHGFIPMVTYDKGEHIIMVGRKPPAKYKSIYVNLAMLVITFLAMMLAGVLGWASYADVPGDETFSVENILVGTLVFTLPLMAILGVHELGHFFMARKRKVAASLPFFIPSIPPLGTFGAFISLRDPIPNRKALLEIGVAGPLAGLAVAIPLAILGLILTNAEARPIPEDLGTGTVASISFPMIYLWLEQLFPIKGDYLLHPTAFAAWVGFLVTALNLLPAGQLDGGHIARALLGKKAKYASWVTIAALIAMSIFYISWMFFAILILFLGSKHPPPLNDINKLDLKRKVIGSFAFVILVIAFVPVPMSIITPDYTYGMESVDHSTNATIIPGESLIFTIFVENLGNTKNNISFEKASSPQGWAVSFKLSTEPDDAYSEVYPLVLNNSQNATMNVMIESDPGTPIGNYTVSIEGSAPASEEVASYTGTMEFHISVILPSLTFSLQDDGQTVATTSSANYTIQVNNTGIVDVTITMSIRDLPAYIAAVIGIVGSEESNWTSTSLEVTVPAEGNITLVAVFFVLNDATLGTQYATIESTYQDLLLEETVISMVVE